MSHTQGPWRASQPEGHNGYAHVSSASSSRRGDIATIWTGERDGVQALADATLMAAAPDLLRELRHLVALIEPALADANIPGLATLNGAKAAIARAEGR